MEKMRAIVRSKYGPPEVLHVETCDKPIPKDDEVLVKIFATSVTNSDIFIRGSKIPGNVLMVIPFRIMMGIFNPRKKIIGQVFAGVVEQTGKKTSAFKPGDKVFGLTGFSLGAYAEYKTIKEINSIQGCISLMPENSSFEEGTAAAYGGLLALQFLDKKTITAGSKILIYGASSTSGIFAVQYLKHLGVEVTGVCRQNKFDFVKSLGADTVLDYTKDESINQLEKYNIVFDCVGKAKRSKLRDACKLQISNQKDFISIDDEPLLLSSKRLLTIKELVEKGVVSPVNDRVYSFDQMIEAHKYVELGHKKGNVAVTVHSTT